MTLENLMAEIGCSKWPKVWSELYPIAKENLEKGEYRCLDENYYDYLENEYSIFKKHPHIDVFKKAAKKTRENKNASLLLALILETLKDREHVFENLNELEYPEGFEGEEKFVYAMLQGLAFLAMADFTAGVLRGRGVPEEMVVDILRNFPGGVTTYRNCNNGDDGFMDFNWNQRMINGDLLPVKRLVAEINSKFRHDVCVFVGDKGEVVSLADGVKIHKDGFALGLVGHEDEEGSWLANITETEQSYMGYPYTPKATVDKTPVTLPKDKWKKILKKGDNVVSLHIPPGGGLTPEIVDETLSEMKAFLQKYFPDYKYEVFNCESWLVDPQLIELLGPDTNISKFTARFNPLSIPDGGTPVFRFVFNIRDSKIDIDSLPENTTLERKLKKHFQSGGHIYGTAGFFTKNDV